MADIEIAANAAEPRDANECFAFGMNYSAGAGVAVDLVASSVIIFGSLLSSIP